jgi:4-alpha-glucanotransferase
VELRNRLGLLTRPVAEELAVDEADRDAWLAALRERHLLSDTDGDVERIVEALHQYVAHTPSKLVGVALTDAVGERRTQNQPGTTDEYPNWRIPLGGPDGEPVLVEDLPNNHRLRRLIGALNI